MKKKSFLLSFLILFALLALVGCKKHSSSETLSKVTLNEVAINDPPGPNLLHSSKKNG